MRRAPRTVTTHALAPASRAPLVAALAWVVLAGCRRDETAPPQPPPQPPYAQPTPYPPPGYGPSAPPGYGTAAPPGPQAPPPGPALARAPGFPCASDADLACAFSHCAAGACGGCATDADCKPNAACTPTPLGGACLARFGGAPQASPTPQVPPQVPPQTADRFEAARQLCVTRTNEYRARVGVRPVVRRPDQEACVDSEAASDTSAGPHATMGRCHESAQNACPNYPGQSPESTLSDCLAQMFAEGPGEPYKDHGHYINMTGPAYTGVACGFFTTPSGKLWINQDFFR